MLAKKVNHTYWSNLVLVLICLQGGERGKGLAMLRELPELEKGDAYCQHNTGRLLIEQEMYDLAAECIARAVSLEPENAEYNYNLAIACLKLYRDEQAEHELAQTIVFSKPGDEVYGPRQAAARRVPAAAHAPLIRTQRAVAALTSSASWLT